MKCQIPFSVRNKNNIPKCHLLKFLPSMLSVYTWKTYTIVSCKQGDLCKQMVDQKILMLFLISNKNIYYGYSFEASQQGTSNKYPQHILLWRNKTFIYQGTPPISRYDLDQYPYLTILQLTCWW